MSEQRRGGKKGRKYGRWARKPHNVAYKSEGRREKNKTRRAARRLKVFAKRAAKRKSE